MKNLSRRANSLPARPEALAAGLNELDFTPLDVEAKVVTSPSLVDPRSPPAIATFSPVFDLELGGSLTSTPHDRHAQSHLRRPAQRLGAAAPSATLRPLDAATPAAAALQKLPTALVHNAGPPAAGQVTGAAGLDRSASDLQVMVGRRNGGGANGAAGMQSAERRTAAGERIAELCKPATGVEMELSKLLRAFRAGRIVKHSPPASAGPSSSNSADRPATAGVAAGPSSGAPAGPTPGESEALASELQSAGFIVQILDGTRLSKDTRLCLRSLKHRFLVCVGRAPAPRRGSLQGTPPGAGSRGLAAGSDAACAAAGEAQQQQQGPQQQGARGEEWLSEPLVVEVRFREQFLIANPSKEYELLLLVLPVVFVGTLRRLDEVVSLMAAEIAAVFKSAKRPLPPWRTKGAMLSKWAPTQLAELERSMQRMARRPAEQQQEIDCEESWGSGVYDASNLPVAAFTVPQDPFAAAITTVMAPTSSRVVFSGPWPWTNRSSADGEHAVASAFAAAADGAEAAAAAAAAVVPLAATTAAAAATGIGDELTDDSSELVPRSNSAPPRTMTAVRDAIAAGAANGDGDRAGGGDDLDRALVQSDGGLPVMNLDSLDKLMRETLSSISQVDPVVSGAPAASRPVGLSADDGAAAAAAAAAASHDLSFPILPEVVPMMGAHAPGAMAPLAPASATMNAVDGSCASGGGGPAALPSFRHMAVLSATSPFASISVPDQYEGGEYDDRESCDRGRHAPWSAQLPSLGDGGGAAAGGGGGGYSDESGIGHAMPEFTFKHTALDTYHAGYRSYEEEDLDLGRRDAPTGGRAAGGGGAARSPGRPLPTPPRAAPLAVIGESPSSASASTSTAAAEAQAVARLTPPHLAHQPLARGAMGPLGSTGGTDAAAAAAAAGAAPAGAASQRLYPSASHPPRRGAPNGDHNANPFNKVDTLSFTRRSSSDLHRAAEKFKKATSLLATALRMAVGGGGSGGSGGGAAAAAASASAAAAPFCSNSQLTTPQRQQQSGVAPEMNGAVPAAAAVATAATAGVADTKHRTTGGVAGSGAAPAPAPAHTAGPGAAGSGLRRAGAGGTQVALAGGVMTQPSGDEPVWARIRTVKWSQPGAGAAAGAAPGAPASGPVLLPIPR